MCPRFWAFPKAAPFYQFPAPHLGCQIRDSALRQGTESPQTPAPVASLTLGPHGPSQFRPLSSRLHKTGAPESTGSWPKVTQRGARQARPSGLAPPWTGCRWGSPFLQNRVCSKSHRRLLEAAKWDVNQGEPRASSGQPCRPERKPGCPRQHVSSKTWGFGIQGTWGVRVLLDLGSPSYASLQ